jgi:phosphotriesterase-related protein
MGMHMRHPGGMNRREAIGLLGAGAGLGLLSSARATAWSAGTWQAGAARASKVAFPKGAIVRTLLRDLSPDALASGVTLFHEHLSIELPPAQPAQQRPANAPAPQPPATSDVSLITEQVKAAAKDGITCIVDGGHADMGRRLEYLKRIANETTVHIVASGGYYMERTYPPELQTRSEDQIADDLVREAGANRYGAFGEIGENPNAAMSALERKVFRAVGKAHVRSNIPIFTHNAYGTGPNVPKDAGLRQLDVLESAGVKPEHIAIGHTCCLDDPEADIIKQIAKRGAWVGFDRVTTLERIVSDDKRVRMVLSLLDAGYGGQLLLSSDFTGARTLEGPLYGRTKTVFGAKLREAGVKDEMLHAILFDNPRRFLAFVPKKSR